MNWFGKCILFASFSLSLCVSVSGSVSPWMCLCVCGQSFETNERYCIVIIVDAAVMALLQITRDVSVSAMAELQWSVSVNFEAYKNRILAFSDGT